MCKATAGACTRETNNGHYVIHQRVQVNRWRTHSTRPIEDNLNGRKPQWKITSMEDTLKNLRNVKPDFLCSPLKECLN
jgi:hypothetical protein